VKVSFLSNFRAFFVTTRRISLGLGILKFVRALLTVYSVILSAKYFGASLERDTWVLAVSSVSVIMQVLFGPINEIFRTKFVHVRAEEGEKKAIACTSSLIYAIIGLSTLFIIIVEVYPGLLSNLFAPGFKGAELETLSLMMRLLIPSLLISEITLVYISVLNVHGSYFIPDIFAFITAVINVVCIIVLVPFIGIYSLFVSSYIGTLSLAIVLLISLKRTVKGVLAFSRPRWVLLRPFIVTSIPFYLSYFIGNAQMAIERMLSTYLGVGNVSVLDYARKFIDMPNSVFVGIITTVVAPVLAEFFINEQRKEFHREVIRTIRFLILSMIPFVALFSVCSKELVELLLVRGSFKRELIEITSQSLSVFCFGAIGYILYAVGAQSLIAQKRAVFYGIVGSIATTVSIILNFAFFRIAGLLIFPFSWGLTLFLSGLYMVLYQNYSRMEIFKEISKMLGMLLLIIAISYASRMLSIHVFYEKVGDIKIHDFLVALTTALISNLLYLCVMRMFNLEEIQGVRRFIAGKIGSSSFRVGKC
jgi:putative peptidoglycan lipid II flippase